MTDSHVCVARHIAPSVHDQLPPTTLSIPSGRVVGLVGPNGAGKTTSLQLAVGLTPMLFGARGIAPIGYAAFTFAL